MQTVTINDIDAQEEGNPVAVDNETDDLGKEEQKSRFIHLRAKGLSYTKIAKELKVSTSTLSNWNLELEEQIARAKALELEALQEEYFMLKEGRIKLLGRQLKTIQEEIRGRDLSKVSTERLMELQLRYFGELKTEYVATAAENKTGMKLNSRDIGEQLQGVLARYRAGEIDESQAKLEQAVLQSMLKGIEQTELATKLERLEAVIGSRR
jgi:transposase